ncbi:MAG: exo-alpha-sialidase [Actinomycetota bacterium]|nr:exo-alpha-sialidase [Actinomycetota bacterium]
MASTKRRPRRPAHPPERNRRRRSKEFPAWAAAATVITVLLVLVVVTRGDSGTGTTPSAGEGVAHVHGLGVNPATGDLYAATHFGVFRVPANGKAEQVGKLVQDTMGFTVVGPDHFLASGHPDVNDKRLRKPGRPPLLGLIESTDGGRSWDPVSLLGEADFHALVAAHGNVYGYDSTGGRFMVSPDGKRWETRSSLGIGDLAVDPADADHLVAATEEGVAESGDGGRSWEPIEGPQLAFLSWSAEQGLWGVSPAGETYRRVEGRWESREALAGEPQALLVTEHELYAAAQAGDGTAIYVSSDGARSWRLRYSDNET